MCILAVLSISIVTRTRNQTQSEWNNKPHLNTKVKQKLCLQIQVNILRPLVKHSFVAWISKRYSTFRHRKRQTRYSFWTKGTQSSWNFVLAKKCGDFKIRFLEHFCLQLISITLFFGEHTSDWSQSSQPEQLCACTKQTQHTSQYYDLRVPCVSLRSTFFSNKITGSQAIKHCNSGNINNYYYSYDYYYSIDFN